MKLLETVTYVLCTFTSAFCSFLLFRAYGRTRTRLLLWTALCFVGLALENAVLTVDMVVLPQADLSAIRNGLALLGVGVLLYALVWESR